MRIGTMTGAAGNSGDLDRVVREARAAEAAGFASFWAPQIFGLDAIAALCVVGRETERIELGTAVVPTYPRHPVALAQQALSAQVASGGRFTLGIGLSHKIVIEDMFGLSYERPARHMREYLEVLVPLLRGESVSYQGEQYRVKAGLEFAGTPRVPLLLAALGSAMLQLCGRYADGTVTWMTGPQTLESHIVPRLRAAASAAGRAEPRVLCSFPIALTNDAEKAREVADQFFKLYGTLPSYRAMLDREGAAGPGDVAIVGSERELRSALERLSEIGVTDFNGAPFPADEGAERRTSELLRSLTG